MSASLEQPSLILTLNSVEVSQQINENTFPVGSGPLFVYYYLRSNTFMIQTNNFSYTLSKDHTISAVNGQSYIFPANESSFIVKITDPISSEALNSFESILKNHGSLSYREELGPNKPELEQPLLDESERENELMIQLETKLGSSSSERPSNFATKGGELTRKGLIWSAKALAKGIEKFGGFVESKYLSKHENKEVKPSIAEKLSKADSVTQTAAKFTKTQAKRLLGPGKIAGDKIRDSELGHKFEHSKYHDSMVIVGKSSVYVVACLYDGLVEAISVIGKGIRDTTAHAVSHKYGEKVGDATKHGFNVIGNIGGMVLVYKDEVNEYICEKNGPVPEQTKGSYQPIPEQNIGNYETKIKLE